MSEMVERVARALAYSAGAKMTGGGRNRASDEFGWKGDGKHLDEYAERHWREHEHAARFAVEAMREPTDAMKDEAVGVLDSHDVGSREAEVVWKAMIDEALK